MNETNNGSKTRYRWEKKSLNFNNSSFKKTAEETKRILELLRDSVQKLKEEAEKESISKEVVSKESKEVIVKSEIESKK